MIAQPKPISLECYRKQCDEIIRVIDENGGALHQDKFDTIFRYKSFGFVFISGASVILGDLSSRPWAKWLDLTQLMVDVGELRQSGRVPNIEYCLLVEVIA